MDVEKVYGKVLENYQSKKDIYEKGKITLVIGTMGAGKSTYIKQNLLDEKVLYIAIDDYVKYFPDIPPNRQYKLCRCIGIRITDYLLDEGISMILEGTGKNEDILYFLARLKKKGYEIKTIFMNTPLSQCIERVEHRNNDKNEQHKVDIDQIKISYNKLWKSGMKEKIAHYSNDYIMM